jgi:hypothetical protein
MKLSDKNKTNNYSLSDTDNFNSELAVSVEEVMNKYTELLVEYINFILENVKIKKFGYANFIINRGLDTITHVFNNMLYYTRNLDLTYFHCQKAFYFYVEFICQISEAEKLFLQLSSRDAATYVYKKTLFEINGDYIKKLEECSPTTKERFELISERVVIDKFLMSFIINTSEKRDPYISQFPDITARLNGISLNKPALQTLGRIVDILHTKIESISCFYTTVDLLVKKLSNNQANLCNDVNKIYDVIDETPTVIVNELFKKP